MKGGAPESERRVATFFSTRSPRAIRRGWAHWRSDSGSNTGRSGRSEGANQVPAGLGRCGSRSPIKARNDFPVEHDNSSADPGAPPKGPDSAASASRISGHGLRNGRGQGNEESKAARPPNIESKTSKPNSRTGILGVD